MFKNTFILGLVKVSYSSNKCWIKTKTHATVSSQKSHWDKKQTNKRYNRFRTVEMWIENQFLANTNKWRWKRKHTTKHIKCFLITNCSGKKKWTKYIYNSFWKLHLRVTSFSNYYKLKNQSSQNLQRKALPLLTNSSTPTSTVCS